MVELEVVKVELPVEWLVVVKGMEQLASSHPRGTQGWRWQEQMQLRAWWQVRRQPGQPGDGQPVGDPALSLPARGDDDDAWEDCLQELGVGGEDPLGGQRGCGGRQWW